MSGLPSGRVKESAIGEKAPQLLKNLKLSRVFKDFQGNKILKNEY